MAKKKTDLPRETGTVSQETACPNCGEVLTKATKLADGGLAYGDCPTCHADPEKAAADSTSAVARERGTDVEGA